MIDCGDRAERFLSVSAMSNETRPIVVAPRPVRLASALFAARRQDGDDLKLSFFADITTPEPADRHSRPPSHSPHRPPSSGLSSEALDEFLSILRPSFMRKPRGGTFPNFLPERPLAFRPLPRADSDPASATRDDQSSPVEHVTDTRLVQADPQADARQWFSSSLLCKCHTWLNPKISLTLLI